MPIYRQRLLVGYTRLRSENKSTCYIYHYAYSTKLYSRRNASSSMGHDDCIVTELLVSPKVLK